MSLRIRVTVGACAAVAIGAAVALVGCAKSDGVRVEGSAPSNAATPVSVTAPVPGQSHAEDVPTDPETEADTDAYPASPPATEREGTPLPAPKLNVVELLKRDPTVKVKTELRACNGDGVSYPLETTYADLTGDGGTDLVVNVSTCTDGLGVASYVYRVVDGRYVNVFAAEQPQVWAQISENHLKVAQQNYLASDPVYDPSSETITTYRWNGRGFEKIAETRNDYGK